MQATAHGLVLSATDLNNYLSCEHLTTLDLAAARGELVRPENDSEQSQLLAELGEQHELAYLRRLIAEGLAVETIDRGAGWAAAAAQTQAAMEQGAAVIYQATFFDGTWIGHADFLRRVPGRPPGGRWEWHYEVEDTKLARDTRPYFLLQLAYYSEHVARIQGAPARFMHVVLGTGERRTFRVDDVAAYYRAVRDRFVARVHAETVATYPVPNDHCELCVWNARCAARRKADDHLSEVANITRLQTARLEAAGVPTLAALADARDDARPAKMVATTFERLRRQARMQDRQRRFGLSFELLPDAAAPGRGFTLLPEPSPGDVFFDMEGDPYYEIGTGLEYLFGCTTPDGAFTPFWAYDRKMEKRAFEAFVDFVMTRRAADPRMHVYHYAAYERTALQKLAIRHGTREAEVDVLLRECVLVDLYRVVRQALVVGQPSYSIKKIEEYYGKRADGSHVKAGDDSILRFEEWRVTRDDAILEDLALYNRYDCESTLHLRDWLLSLRPAIPFFERAESEEQKKPDPRYPELKAAIDARLGEDGDETEPLWLARQMLEYHWREDKPVYWRFYDRCDTYVDEPQQLLDDVDAIVGLEPVGEPTPDKKSQVFTFSFPPQLHRLAEGDEVFDLATTETTGVIAGVNGDGERGVLMLRRGPKRAALPLPRGIVTRDIVRASTVLDALARFAQALYDEGERCRFRAAYDVLVARAPRLRGIAAGARIQPEHPDETSLRALCDALDDSYLFVQGPPGAGKTYAGGRLIVDLLARGKKVGITANSHKAIHNLLDEVERVAAARGVEFRGLKKASNGDDAYESPHVTTTRDAFDPTAADLFAGTAWAFGHAAMDASLDYLFIDEAGQVSLPAAIATMTAARSVVLLGDPLQLPHVAHTEHPGDVGASVLLHLLGRKLEPVAPDRGVLLTDSYRMHPDVCSFISDLLYEGKLHAAPGRERQRVDGGVLRGTGLRYMPVEHAGNGQSSLEEAEAIADAIAGLLRGTVTDVDGRTRPCVASDVIVVAPYNMQVSCIRKVLAARGLGDVQAGTVDKFQGREAYVVFFSTAASTPDDAPRGVRFVFDRQRFNVAVSRARALAVLVASPALLVQSCAAVEDVRVANGVARFVELAERVAAGTNEALIRM